MAKSPELSEKVKATVVRGSFWVVDKDGNRKEVKPNQGKDSEVEVTRGQLLQSVGTLVLAEHADAEIRRVANESMAPPTPTDTATTAPTQQPTQGESSRRNR